LYNFFTRTTLASAGISCRHVSVHLSQVGVLLKRLNVGSRKQRHTIAQGLFNSSFLLLKISTKLKRGHPQRRRQMQVG